MTSESAIAKGRALSESSAEAAIVYFRRLADACPEDGRVHFELASVLDGASREAEAIPQYQKALDLGLTAEDRAGALLGLGSSLRVVGKYKEAIELLKDAVKEFPDHRPLKAFQALARIYAGIESDSAIDQLNCLLVEGQLGVYEAVLRRYAVEVTQVSSAMPGSVRRSK